MYVPTVALTRLLADPEWKALALIPKGNAAFVAEVRRTVDPAYTWHPFPYHQYIEPLARTLLEERERRDFETGTPEAPRSYYIPRLPPRPGEVIESGELCQDGWDESVSHSR